MILALRDGSTSLAEVKQIGLTLDEGLLRFDQYMIRRQRLPINTAPTFFLPSMLLRRLRSFIPLKTNDYRKAFFRAVSTKTFDPENGQLSIAIQRSVAYFNALGIDNPKVMMQMLHDEIFLSGLEEAHIQGKVEEFTKSELDRKFGNMEKYIETLSSKIEAFAAENEQQMADFQQQKNWFSEENEKVKRLAKAKIDEQHEEKQKINLLHTQELDAERERSRLEQEKLKMEKELETNKSLLIKLDPIVERLTLQNKKLDERAKFHLSLFSAGIGIIISISILLFKSELIEIKKFTGDIYFAFILPAALFGFAYWVRMGKKFTDDQENIRIRLIRWYRKGLNRKNDFDPNYHQSLLDETERLRIEIKGGTNSVMKLISQENK